MKLVRNASQHHGMLAQNLLLDLLMGPMMAQHLVTCAGLIGPCNCRCCILAA